MGAQESKIELDPKGSAGGDLIGLKVSETGNNTTKFHIYRNFTNNTSDIDFLTIDASGSTQFMGNVNLTGATKLQWDPLNSAGGDFMGFKVSEAGNNTTKLHIYRNFTNNTNDIDLLTIDPLGNVGIGTTNPGSKLDVTGDIRLNGITADASNTKRNSFSLLLKSSGYASDNRARFQYWAVQSVSRSEWGSGDLTFLSNTDGAGNNEIVRFRNDGNVGIGTSAPDAKLAVKGNIHTNEVKVDLLGAVAPDYVFYKDYDLKTLNEVESYITKEGHLPNIPSAKEMETNGLLLKEMNLKLLEKIEELTLYTINQEKRINTLEQENNTLKEQQKRIKLLEEQMALLLKIKE